MSNHFCSRDHISERWTIFLHFWRFCRFRCRHHVIFGYSHYVKCQSYEQQLFILLIEGSYFRRPRDHSSNFPFVKNISKEFYSQLSFGYVNFKIRFLQMQIIIMKPSSKLIRESKYYSCRIEHFSKGFTTLFIIQWRRTSDPWIAFIRKKHFRMEWQIFLQMTTQYFSWYPFEIVSLSWSDSDQTIPP